jgi:hypothetical protein
MTIRLIKTDSELLETIGHCIGGEWYHMPFWFRKVGEGLYEEYSFDKLPESFKKTLEQMRMQDLLYPTPTDEQLNK